MDFVGEPLPVANLLPTQERPFNSMPPGTAIDQDHERWDHRFHMKNSTSAKRTIPIDLPELTSVNMGSALTTAGVSQS